MAVQLTGMVPICPPCLCVDVLAMALAIVGLHSSTLPASQSAIELGPPLPKVARGLIVATGFLVLAAYLVPSRAVTAPLGFEWHLAKPPRIGQLPPATKEVRDGNGVALDLKAHLGRWTAVAWGAPSCESCRELSGELGQFADLDVVHVWPGRGWGLTQTNGYSEKSMATARTFGVAVMPTLTIINPQGRIAATITGFEAGHLQGVVAALQGKASDQYFSTGYDDYLVAAGRVRAEPATTFTYLPSFDEAGKKRIAWLQKHFPSYNHVLWCKEARARSLQGPKLKVKNPTDEYLGRFGSSANRPLTYIVDKGRRIEFFEQAASPFPPRRGDAVPSQTP